MSARASHKADAILLRSINYGESDRIVTFFTDEYGKVVGIAKGARRSQKRFANALESFSLVRLMFSRRNREGLALIEACEVGCHYPGIRTDLEKTLTATYLVELVDHFTLEGKSQAAVFRILKDYLDVMEGGKTSEGFVRIFELQLLRLLGYEPVMDRCITCGTRLEDMAAILFDPLEGGIRCQACDPGVRAVYPLMPGTVKLLLLGKTMSVDRLGRLVFSQTAAAESRKALAAFIQHLLGRELKSLNVLNEIKRMAL